jgi:hypothetical protein
MANADCLIPPKFISETVCGIPCMTEGTLPSIAKNQTHEAILWSFIKPKSKAHYQNLYYPVYSSPPLFPILSQFNLVHINPLYPSNVPYLEPDSLCPYQPTLRSNDPPYYSPTYVSFFLVVFFLLAFTPKPCRHYFSLTCMLHALPKSSSLT